MAKIICSHGFGVAADARGMFTNIASAFLESEFVMFDYNTFDKNGNVFVEPLEDQAKKLQQVIDENVDADILLCHSQGSIISGMVDLRKVKKVILLAPPTKSSMERVITMMMKRPGSVVNLDGVSKLPRSDGSYTLIPKEFVQSLSKTDPQELYSDLSSRVPTVIVRAVGDKLLGHTNFDKLIDAEIIDIDADHDFSGTARTDLIKILEPVIYS